MKSIKEEKGLEEMINKYEISLHGDDKIRIGNVYRLNKDNAEDMIRAKKPEIINCLKEKKAEATRQFNERQEKIRAIEGLEEIRTAIEEQVKWREDFNRAMESEDGCILRTKPADNIGELKQKYPRAAAYLTAETEAFKTNYELSAIGRNALERIINGEDYELVLIDMKKQQSEFCERHLWD